jgi:hypothetical protein
MKSTFDIANALQDKDADRTVEGCGVDAVVLFVLAQAVAQFVGQVVAVLLTVIQ